MTAEADFVKQGEAAVMKEANAVLKASVWKDNFILVARR